MNCNKADKEVTRLLAQFTVWTIIIGRLLGINLIKDYLDVHIQLISSLDVSIDISTFVILRKSKLLLYVGIASLTGRHGTF